MRPRGQQKRLLSRKQNNTRRYFWVLYSFLRPSFCQAPFWCQLVWWVLDLRDEGCASSPSFSYSSMATRRCQYRRLLCVRLFLLLARAWINAAQFFSTDLGCLGGNLKARVKGCATNDRAWILRPYARFVQTCFFVPLSLAFADTLYNARARWNMKIYKFCSTYIYAKQ